WGERLLSLVEQWPESLENVRLSEASERIDARVEAFTALAGEIERLGLATLSTSIAEIQKEIERRLKLKTIKASMADNPIFDAIGEPTLRTLDGCRALQFSAQIMKGIDIASPDPSIRSRLFSNGSANFRRLLDSAASSIAVAIENYQNALARLS